MGDSSTLPACSSASVASLVAAIVSPESATGFLFLGARVGLSPAAVPILLLRVVIAAEMVVEYPLELVFPVQVTSVPIVHGLVLGSIAAISPLALAGKVALAVVPAVIIGYVEPLEMTRSKEFLTLEQAGDSPVKLSQFLGTYWIQLANANF